jgi:hypothetical protein
MKTSLFLLAVASSQICNANDSKETPIEVVATEIEGVFHGETPGVYNQIYETLIEGYAPTVQLTHVPVKRAIRHFLDAGSHCFFIGIHEIDKMVADGSPSLRHSQSFNTLIGNLYVLKGKPLPGNLEGLGKARIATTFSIHDMFKRVDSTFSDLNLLPLESSGRALELLEAGRVPYAFAFGKDVLSSKGSEFLSRFAKGPEVVRFHEAMSCWETPRTVQFIEFLNKRITKLKQQKYFESLLQKN